MRECSTRRGCDVSSERVGGRAGMRGLRRCVASILRHGGGVRAETDSSDVLGS